MIIDISLKLIRNTRLRFRNNAEEIVLFRVESFRRRFHLK